MRARPKCWRESTIHPLGNGIGGLAELTGDTLRLRGEILRGDGSEVLVDDQSCPVSDGAALGQSMAAKLLAQAGPDFFDH